MEVSEPYIYEGEFLNDNKQKIKYKQLKVDITLPDENHTVIHLTRSLKGFEGEYLKMFMDNK